MTELGQLALDITCAIKSNMPNAVVAIDHSTWNSDELTDSFWNTMNIAPYDIVWTTGVGNNNGFMAEGTDSSTYNHKTATYSYLHNLTKRPILVDTSAGASAAGDSWSTASAAEINRAHFRRGVSCQHHRISAGRAADQYRQTGDAQRRPRVPVTSRQREGRRARR